MGWGFEFNINISIFAKSSWMMFVKNIFISLQLTYKPLSWSFSISTCTFSTKIWPQCDIRFKKTSYLDCKQMKILIWSLRQIIIEINQIIRVNMTFLKNIWTQTIILVSGAVSEQWAVQCGIISIMIIMSLWSPDLAAGAAAAWPPTITDGNIKINDAHYNNF